LESYSKKLGRGLFGGEGFISKIRGHGMAFVHAGGTTAKKSYFGPRRKPNGRILAVLLVLQRM